MDDKQKSDLTVFNNWKLDISRWELDIPRPEKLSNL